MPVLDKLINWRIHGGQPRMRPHRSPASLVSTFTPQQAFKQHAEGQDSPSNEHNSKYCTIRRNPKIVAKWLEVVEEAQP